jgi:hypothetical protein
MAVTVCRSRHTQSPYYQKSRSGPPRSASGRMRRSGSVISKDLGTKILPSDDARRRPDRRGFSSRGTAGIHHLAELRGPSSSLDTAQTMRAVAVTLHHQATRRLRLASALGPRGAGFLANRCGNGILPGNGGNRIGVLPPAGLGWRARSRRRHLQRSSETMSPGFRAGKRRMRPEDIQTHGGSSQARDKEEDRNAPARPRSFCTVVTASEVWVRRRRRSPGIPGSASGGNPQH